MSPKEKYKQLCESEKSIPLFMQHWWMEAVCVGKEWDVILLSDDNIVVAAMPYLWGKKLGMKYIIHPQQTQINGIWIKPTVSDDIERVNHICDEITAKITDLKLAYYYQQFPINSACPSVLKAKGFKIKERLTYRIEDLSNLEKMIASFSKNKKRQLQKALASHVDFDMTGEEFYRFHSSCMLEQKKQISYSREFFLILYKKAKQRNQAHIIAIKNADNCTQAALFLVWDENSAYYLIPCYSTVYKESGASALLVLEAIKFARTKAKAFDFEGSMIRGVANHYKQFGTTKTLYYSVEKRNNFCFDVLLFVNKLRTWKKK